MCYDGTCIDPHKSSCSVSDCPISIPVKCSDGKCVKSKSMCHTKMKLTGYCEKNEVLCADGRCVSKAEFCRPLTPCGYGYIRCADGSCRRDMTKCPIGLEL